MINVLNINKMIFINLILFISFVFRFSKNFTELNFTICFCLLFNRKIAKGIKVSNQNVKGIVFKKFIQYNSMLRLQKLESLNYHLFYEKKKVQLMLLIDLYKYTQKNLDYS